jgi:transcriptional regulator with XRE-family HTH domain
MPAAPHYTATDIDRHVGRRLRALRKDRRITMAQLGLEVDRSGQQIEKYEQGIDRISSGVLYGCAAALHVPVESFFEGLS